jgi:hypothetical protein
MQRLAHIPKGKRMATETKTAAKTDVKTSAKVVGAIVALITAIATYVSKKRIVAEAIVSESKRMGLDEDQSRAMVTASWLEAQGIKPSEATKEQKDSVRFDVSKVMALAYPANDQAAADLAKAYAFNDSNAKGKKQSRIGEEKLLQIARAKITFAEAQAGKQKQNLDKTQTPSEKMLAALETIVTTHRVGLSERCDIAATHKLLDKAYANIVGERKAQAEKK